MFKYDHADSLTAAHRMIKELAGHMLTLTERIAKLEGRAHDDDEPPVYKFMPSQQSQMQKGFRRNLRP